MTSYSSKRNPDPTCAQEGKRAGTFLPVFRVPKRLAGVLPFHHPSPISSSKTHSRKWHQDKNAGKDLLEWGVGGRRKLISCLLLSDFSLSPSWVYQNKHSTLPANGSGERQRGVKSPCSPRQSIAGGAREAVIYHQQRSASVWGTRSMTSVRESRREEKATAAAASWRTTFHTAWRVCRMMEDRPCLRPLQPPYLFKGRKSISVCHYSPPLLYPQSLSPCPFFPLDPAQQSLCRHHHPPPLSVLSRFILTRQRQQQQRLSHPAVLLLQVQTVPPSRCSCSWLRVPPRESLHPLLHLAQGECPFTHLWIPPWLSQIPSPQVCLLFQRRNLMPIALWLEAFTGIQVILSMSLLQFSSRRQKHHHKIFFFLYYFVCLKTSCYMTSQYQKKKKAFKTASLLSFGKICFALKEEVV